jgi:hypothetical protein
MSIPQGPEQVCTLAADLLKTDNVNDIVTPEKDIEIYCHRWYDQTRRAVLEQGQYRFSCAREQLARSTEDPAFGYTDQYALPANFCGLRFIEDDTIPLTKWEYAIENGYILINNSGSESLNIGYVKDVEDVTKMSASFRDLLAAELAYRVSFLVTGKNSDFTRIEKLVTRFKNAAQAADGLSCPLRSYSESRIAGARRQYSGGSSGYIGYGSQVL